MLETIDIFFIRKLEIKHITNHLHQTNMECWYWIKFNADEFWQIIVHTNVKPLA
jgi:hypothetical protein